MNSTSIISSPAPYSNDFSSTSISEVSKSLFSEIKWDEITRSGVVLQAKDHQLLERAQTSLAVVLDNDQDAKDWANILLRIAERCSSNFTIQKYVFIRVEEILGLGTDYFDTDVEVFGGRNAKLFFHPGTTNIIDKSFLKALTANDHDLQKIASLALASLFSYGQGNIQPLVDWIFSKFADSAQGSELMWEMALPTLMILVRCNASRKIIVDSNGLHHIIGRLNLVGANGNAQFIYDLSFIIWALTLSEVIQIKEFLSANVISTLTDFLSKTPSRKVTRVIVAALRNLAETGSDEVFTEMFATSTEKVLANLMLSAMCKNANDSDFDDDVKTLDFILRKNYRELSTFDRWSSEVLANALRWGVVHTEKFWRDNYKQVEYNEFKLLKALIAILRQSRDPTIISIALYDLGEFARFYPNGRGVVSKLGGKDIAMTKIADEDPTIQRYALQAVSKIMVTNWDFMN